MKINYENKKLTINDVSMDLFKRIIQILEQHEADQRRDQRAEEWRAMAVD